MMIFENITTRPCAKIGKGEKPSTSTCTKKKMRTAIDHSQLRRVGFVDFTQPMRGSAVLSWSRWLGGPSGSLVFAFIFENGLETRASVSESRWFAWHIKLSHIAYTRSSSVTSKDQWVTSKDQWGAIAVTRNTNFYWSVRITQWVNEQTF